MHDIVLPTPDGPRNQTICAGATWKRTWLLASGQSGPSGSIATDKSDMEFTNSHEEDIKTDT
eukprot:scaffold20718_cov106-Isochrysis_galbana.AAC.2